MIYNFKNNLDNTVGVIRKKDEEKRLELSILGLSEEDQTNEKKKLDIIIEQEFKKNEPISIGILIFAVTFSVLIFLMLN